MTFSVATASCSLLALTDAELIGNETFVEDGEGGGATGDTSSGGSSGASGSSGSTSSSGSNDGGGFIVNGAPRDGGPPTPCGDTTGACPGWCCTSPGTSSSLNRCVTTPSACSDSLLECVRRHECGTNMVCCIKQIQASPPRSQSFCRAQCEIGERIMCDNMMSDNNCSGGCNSSDNGPFGIQGDFELCSN